MHGTHAQVVCLGCGHTMTRAQLTVVLEARNPQFGSDADGLAVAPDADAEVTDTSSLRRRLPRRAAAC